jgi:hypothetical protein
LLFVPIVLFSYGAHSRSPFFPGTSDGRVRGEREKRKKKKEKETTSRARK